MSNRFLTANGTPASGPSRTACRARRIDRLGPRARARCDHRGERVEHAVILCDPRQRGVDHRARADRAVGDGGGNLARVRPSGVHRASNSVVMPAKGIQ